MINIYDEARNQKMRLNRVTPFPQYAWGTVVDKPPPNEAFQRQLDATLDGIYLPESTVKALMEFGRLVDDAGEYLAMSLSP